MCNRTCNQSPRFVCFDPGSGKFNLTTGRSCLEKVYSTVVVGVWLHQTTNMFGHSHLCVSKYSFIASDTQNQKGFKRVYGCNLDFCTQKERHFEILEYIILLKMSYKSNSKQNTFNVSLYTFIGCMKVFLFFLNYKENNILSLWDTLLSGFNHAEVLNQIPFTENR